MNTMSSLELHFLIMLCQGFPLILKFLFFFQFYLILFGMFLCFVSFNLTGSLMHILASSLVFLWVSWVCERGGSVSRAFSSSVLFYPNVLVLILSYYIILYHYSLEVHLFSDETEREWIWTGWEVGRNGRGNHMQGTLFRKKIFSKTGKESLTFHNQTCTNNFMQPVSPVKGVFALEIHLIKTRTGMTGVVLFADCSGEDGHMECHLGYKSGVHSHRLHFVRQSLRWC